ncbi:Lipoprotein-anchoring transpeptidase ErfK/SrfK [Brevibacterium iodinum ATCC 49514]|uniref:Lipoprotein-anchoring transpeptidase ErfK/SrfK n=1 Tax=Brevibacterium iodinum ATCC 49514 TaxID=1255616 RepID=A0A2H1K8E0_9MICO|nr:Ig-like domain-containing protein [Brevibacterium iodinum]SMX95946.1 Lipoprotein-anchoring transpeptidase ErfK/SrfK [Brevibacterium iodinum ATCC 49514]SUW11378.1 L,D-transpeptidase catalytic domain [Brevibacterium iodinum]
MSSKIQGAIAALSALALLTACTPSSSDPNATRKDANKTAKAAADPVFRVGAIPSEAAESASESTPSSQPSDATSSAQPSESADAAAAMPGAADFGEVTESGDDIDLEAGQRIGISVENADLSDISVTEEAHPRIAHDPGMFFDASGTALETDDDAQAGSSTTSSTESETADDGSKDAQADNKDTAEAVDAPDESAAWISTYGLVADSEYTLKVTATTADGDEVDLDATITVGASDGAPMSVRTTLADDQTVGVAAPIMLNFGSTVSKDFRDDVERRLSVKVTDEDGKEREVEGSWGWLYDDPQSRLHFRPKEFWPAHSKVSVDVPLKDVPTGENSVGQNDLTLDFEIGRKQVVKADAKSHRMTVTRDGKTVMDFPASLGAPKSPSFNGTHVVMSKAADYTMTSEQWDYETDVQWAVRIHNNGEFIHAAPWSAGVQGSQNVSHGCINLTTERAKEYYDSAIFGDPVEVTGSQVSLSTNDSDISDWVYSWDEWKKLSALE